MAELLADIFSFGDTAKRKIRGLLDDPSGTIAQFIGNENDRAGQFNQLTRSATDEMVNRIRNGGGMGASEQRLAGLLADAYNPAGMVKAIDDKAARMAAMGVEGGWYRGGAAPENGRRTGPWYTKDKSEAESYAKRFGSNGDVREYAIPSNRFLNASGGYPSRLAHDLADLLDQPYYGKQGSSLAKEFRSFKPDEPISGGTVWQALESRFGNDGAADVLSQLQGGKAFKGVKGIAGPDEALVFKNHPVRDVEKAAFDPSKYGVDDIYGRASTGLLGAIAGGAGLAALYNRQGQQ